MSNLMEHGLGAAIHRLRSWIEAEDFRGWDPYDSLNSPIVRFLSLDNRLLSIAWVQLLRRSPANFRPLLGIKKAHNVKGLGLLMAAYLRLYLQTPSRETLTVIERLSSWLEERAIEGYSGACWGFNFDWPNRSFFAPAGTPTVVNTSLIAGAFLDGYEYLGREPWLDLARSACEFIMNDLNRHEDLSGICFSYTPLDRRRVHNANVLGAALLERVARHTGELALKDVAARAVAFTISRQRDDGSWLYGEDTLDGWVDNYHTGMLLDALGSYSELSEAESLSRTIMQGLDFYSRRLFRDDYVPKYAPNRVYPIDIHSVAQAILTFVHFQHLDKSLEERAHALAQWAQENMLDAEGFFHYQIHRLYRIRIPYMRWGQAWMLRALAELRGVHV